MNVNKLSKSSKNIDLHSKNVNYVKKENVQKQPQMKELYSSKTSMAYQSMALGLINSNYFQRSVQSTQNEPVNWTNEKISEVFDKTFNKFFEQNPIISQLNYQKPQVYFDPDVEEDNNAIASYSFVTNDIRIKNDKYFSEDLFLLKYYDGVGDLADIKILPESDIPSTEANSKADGENLRTEKNQLTEEEKELYISSILAHELRHSVQDHITMSTQDCKGSFANSIKSIKDSYQAILESERLLLELTDDPQKKKEVEQEIQKYESSLNKMEYSLNYQPKQIFDDNMTLKFSLNPQDNRYLSIKEHFCNADKNSLAYEERPCEIDAFNYQGEFIITQAKNKTNGLRSDVVHNMSLLALMQSNANAIF